MKYLLFMFCFICTATEAQNILDFRYRYTESENKWVATRTNNDSIMNFGFVYIDGVAGLTLDYAGSFTILKDGKFVPKKLDTVSIKYRLQPNNVKLAFIPPSKFSELGIQEYPRWLKTYLGDTTSIEHLYRWGFLYNGYNECSIALRYLEKAQKINPNYNGLAVELSFSYNCLGQYNNAASVLQNALKQDPQDAYANKELIYARVHAGQLDKAAENCTNAIEHLAVKTYNGENCYNLLHAFYEKKDKAGFNKWLAETKKWNAGNNQLLENIKRMEDTMNR